MTHIIMQMTMWIRQTQNKNSWYIIYLMYQVADNRDFCDREICDISTILVYTANPNKTLRYL